MYSLHHNGYRLLKCTVTNTGHTQTNGAVLIMIAIKTAPFFCVYLVFHVSTQHRTKMNGARVRKGLNCLKSPLKCFQSAKYISISMCVFVGRDSSVGIATRYELDGPGIESR